VSVYKNIDNKVKDLVEKDYHLGLYQHIMGDFEEAYKHYKAVLEDHNANPTWHFTIRNNTIFLIQQHEPLEGQNRHQAINTLFKGFLSDLDKHKPNRIYHAVYNNNFGALIDSEPRHMFLRAEKDLDCADNIFKYDSLYQGVVYANLAFTYCEKLQNSEDDKLCLQYFVKALKIYHKLFNFEHYDCSILLKKLSQFLIHTDGIHLSNSKDFASSYSDLFQIFDVKTKEGVISAIAGIINKLKEWHQYPLNGRIQVQVQDNKKAQTKEYLFMLTPTF